MTHAWCSCQFWVNGSIRKKFPISGVEHSSTNISNWSVCQTASRYSSLWAAVGSCALRQNNIQFCSCSPFSVTQLFRYFWLVEWETAFLVQPLYLVLLTLDPKHSATCQLVFESSGFTTTSAAYLGKHVVVPDKDSHLVMVPFTIQLEGKFNSTWRRVMLWKPPQRRHHIFINDVTTFNLTTRSNCPFQPPRQGK